jgi:hypothetical protein
MKPTVFELEVKEQRQIERDYRDWCRKYDPNYIVEHNEDEEFGDRYIKTDNQTD